MNHPLRIAMFGIRQSLFPPLLVLAAFFHVSAAAAGSTPATLPDTPAGKLSGELIRHVNHDTAAQIQRWASTILSSAVAPDDKAQFVTDLASAARDSGGLDVFDVRTDPRQPGLLEVAVKGRRNGRAGLFWLVADPAHPGRLADARLVPMDDPLYADWPKGPVSHAELRKRIHTLLDRLVSTSDFSGCVTVFDGGETVFDECHGLAERSFNVPVACGLARLDGRQPVGTSRHPADGDCRLVAAGLVVERGGDR